MFLLFISRAAIERALPEVGRSALFADLLMMRYCAPNAESLVAEIQSPTVATGDFTKAVRAYAGLVPAEADPDQPGWRLHESVAEADPRDYFFALASGGTGREKRWKKGGFFYARSGLHNRLYAGVRGVLGRCIDSYGPAGVGEDRWTLQLTEDYVRAAFEGLLRGEPIPFWSFTSWLLRAVKIPGDDRDDAISWMRRTTMDQARLTEAHVADTKENAIARAAWFYLGPQPDASELLSNDRLGFEELRDTCAHFDERVEPAATDEDEATETQSDLEDLRAALLDAGSGRRLIFDEEVLSSVLTHLLLGRHLLLIGPPGTGKSTLAANIARAARDELIAGVVPPNDSHSVTASSAWTTFDTLGGYLPTRHGELEFRPGVFLRAFRAGAWLLIDELNRADADKAFGPFMGVLAGSRETQELPFDVTLDGATVPVRLVSGRDEPEPETINEYVVPEGWRLIATMNTYDKNSLFRLSYAFVRRFAFVYIGTLDIEATLEAATQGVALEQADEVRLRTLLQTCEGAGRALGVAVAADIARYVEAARQHGDVAEPFLDALVAHVLPQLDSLEPDVVRRVLETLITGRVVAEGSRSRLENVFRQMLDYGG